MSQNEPVTLPPAIWRLIVEALRYQGRTFLAATIASEIPPDHDGPIGIELQGKRADELRLLAAALEPADLVETDVVAEAERIIREHRRR